MKLSRRTFLKGMAATAAGLLIPADVLAEPERRIWALDQTMTLGQGARASMLVVDSPELVWVQSYEHGVATVVRGFAGTQSRGSESVIEIVGPAVYPGDVLTLEDDGLRPLGLRGLDQDNWMLRRLANGFAHIE